MGRVATNDLAVLRPSPARVLLAIGHLHQYDACSTDVVIPLPREVLEHLAHMISGFGCRGPQVNFKVVLRFDLVFHDVKWQVEVQQASLNVVQNL